MAKTSKVQSKDRVGKHCKLYHKGLISLYSVPRNRDKNEKQKQWRVHGRKNYK